MSDPEYGHEYDVVEIESATVLTVVPYTEGAEFREYHAEGKDELAEILHDMENPQIAESVVSVDVEQQ